MQNTTAQNKATAGTQIVLKLRAGELQQGDRIITLHGYGEATATEPLQAQTVYNFDTKQWIGYAQDGAIIKWDTYADVLIYRTVAIDAETAIKTDATAFWMFEVWSGIANYRGIRRGKHDAVRAELLHDFGNHAIVYLTLVN